MNRVYLLFYSLLKKLYQFRIFFIKKKLQYDFNKNIIAHKKYIKSLENKLDVYYRKTHKVYTCKYINDIERLETTKILINNKKIEYFFYKNYLPDVTPEMKDLIELTENLIDENKEKIKEWI